MPQAVDIRVSSVPFVFYRTQGLGSLAT